MNDKFELWYEANCEYVFLKFTAEMKEYFETLRAFAFEMYIESLPA